MTVKVAMADLPDELASRLDQFAAQSNRSTSSIVEQAVAEWLAWEEEKERRTVVGLAQARAGKTVTHEDMLAWANSLTSETPLPLPRAK